MTVRDARLPQDEPAILSFINGLQDHEAKIEPDRRRDPSFAAEHWRVLQHRCAEKHGHFLIAEDEGKAVGWAFVHEAHGELFVTEPERRHGYLSELYVAPSVRGKGFGRALMRACEDWSRARGHKLLMLGVLVGNASAIRIYQGDGYAPYVTYMRKYL
jgi:GNAT superfamily N-acetyltransferase